MEIPPGLEDLWYEMNPFTDDFLPNGTLLRDGMIVLVEAWRFREDISGWEELSELDKVKARQNNRWARISEISIDNGVVRFVAAYFDRVKVLRSYDVSNAWLVKRESLRIHPFLQDSRVDINNKKEVHPEIASQLTGVEPNPTVLALYGTDEEPKEVRLLNVDPEKD